MLRDAKKGIERRVDIEKRVSPTLRCCFNDFRGVGSPTSSGSMKALPRRTDIEMSARRYAGSIPALRAKHPNIYIIIGFLYGDKDAPQWKDG